MVIFQSTGINGFIRIFSSLAKKGITFNCTFEKLDGSTRNIDARILGGVEFNRKKRESYVNVVDLSLPVGKNNDRKIVLQRVEAVKVGDFTFRA